MKVTLYQKAKTDNTKVWILECRGKELITTWGLDGGALQTTVDVVEEKGKGKAYKTPEEQALLEFDRKVKKQKEKGYSESKENLAEVKGEDFEINFKELPSCFCPPKPRKDPPSEGILRDLKNSNRLLVQKKYEGARILILVDENSNVNLYTRTMEPCTQHFITIANKMSTEFKSRGVVNSLFDSEFYVNRGETLEDFDIVSGMTPNTKPETSQEKQKLHPVNVCIFDVLYFKSEKWLTKPYRERLGLINAITQINVIYTPYILGEKPITFHTPFHTPEVVEIDYIIKPVNVAPAKDITNTLTYHIKNNVSSWEGFVLRDLDSISGFTTNGKETRPDGCWKFKVSQEDDFVATGYTLGSGKNKNRAGRLNLIQYGRNGEVYDCGDVGIFRGGEEIRDEILNWIFPCVVKIEYEKRQVKTGSMKLRFPVFVTKRNDKKPEECVVNV